MVYRAESQPIPGSLDTQLRRAHIEDTNATAITLQDLIEIEGLSDHAAVVTSAAEVKRLVSSSTLETIFVIDGPKNGTDSGQLALNAIQLRFSQMNVVLISEFPLDSQKIGMYRALGANEVLAAYEFEPTELINYIPNPPRKTATAA